MSNYPTFDFQKISHFQDTPHEPAHGGHHNWQQRHDWGQDGGYGYQDGGYGYGEHGGWEKPIDLLFGCLVS